MIESQVYLRSGTMCRALFMTSDIIITHFDNVNFSKETDVSTAILQPSSAHVQLKSCSTQIVVDSPI